MELSVIIVNFNVKYFLEHCLHAVIKASGNIHTEILVIDNASTDGSRQFLSSKFPAVTFIWQETNSGFATANNEALKLARGEFVLFLNPDTIVPEDCFEKCLSFYKSNSMAGVLGVHMVDGSGKFLKESKRSFPTAAGSFFKLTGLAALFPSSKTFAGYYAGQIKENENNEVDVLAGAFMLISRKCLDVVKGFDEDYFMYGEDIDLCFRINEKGLKNYYFAGTSIIHFKGESTQKLSAHYVRVFYNAMRIFVMKHYVKNSVAFWFMQAGINVSEALSKCKSFFLKKLSGNKIPQTDLRIAIISAQRRFEEIIMLIRFAEVPFIILGRISTLENDADAHIGKVNDIQELIKKYKLDEVLFCEGDDLSYKSIIEMMKRNPGIGYLFHSAGSSSVIGSINKNEKGVIIAKR